MIKVGIIGGAGYTVNSFAGQSSGSGNRIHQQLK